MVNKRVHKCARWCLYSPIGICITVVSLSLLLAWANHARTNTHGPTRRSMNKHSRDDVSNWKIHEYARTGDTQLDPHDIDSVCGWRSLSEAVVYTRPIKIIVGGARNVIVFRTIDSIQLPTTLSRPRLMLSKSYSLKSRPRAIRLRPRNNLSGR